MSLRDLIVAGFVLAALPACFRRPLIGVLVFSILGYMRIQDLAWGFARFQRWSFYVAVTSIAGYFVDRTRKPPIIEARTVLMILLAIVIGIGNLFAKGPGPVEWPNYIEFCKIVGIAVFTTAVVHNREHLRALVWVIAMSFGFYGVKSGIQGVMTGGSMTIDRGPGGMLYDNNNFALAMVMSIPFLVHLSTSEKSELFRRTLKAMVPLTMITVVMTRSRGGFLSMCVAIGIMVWRSRSRIMGLGTMALAGGALLLLAPQSYLERLGTIRNYEQDGSAMGRLAAWKVASNMIRENPVFGVGLDRFKQNYIRYDYDRPPGMADDMGTRVAHNSYLQIWAECGSIAFGLYMLMLLLTVLDLMGVRRQAARRYHASWILSYASMFEASMLGFLCGSMFLNRAQFDLIYHYVAIVLVFGRLARAEMADEKRYPMRVRNPRSTGPLSILEDPGFGRRGQRVAAFREARLLAPEKG